MAKRDSSGKMKGAITDRIQAKNPITGKWVKIDTSTGKIMSHKKTSGPYKGVRRK